jgi:hypothetical protein
MSPKSSQRPSRKNRRRAKRGRRQSSGPKRVEIDAAALVAIVERTGDGALSDEDRAMLSAAVDTLTVLTQDLEASDVTIGRLRRLLFGPQSEKTREVVGAAGEGGRCSCGRIGRSRVDGPADPVE